MVPAGRDTTNYVQSRSWNLSVRFDIKQRFILLWNIKHNLRLFSKSQNNIFLRQPTLWGVFIAVKVLYMSHCGQWTQIRSSLWNYQRPSIKRKPVYNSWFWFGANVIGNYLLSHLQACHCLALGFHFKTLFWFLSPWFL